MTFLWPLSGKWINCYRILWTQKLPYRYRTSWSSRLTLHFLLIILHRYQLQPFANNLCAWINHSITPFLFLISSSFLFFFSILILVFSISHNCGMCVQQITRDYAYSSRVQTKYPERSDSYKIQRNQIARGNTIVLMLVYRIDFCFWYLSMYQVRPRTME